MFDDNYVEIPLIPYVQGLIMDKMMSPLSGLQLSQHFLHCLPESISRIWQYIKWKMMIADNAMLRQAFDICRVLNVMSCGEYIWRKSESETREEERQRRSRWKPQHLIFFPLTSVLSDSLCMDDFSPSALYCFARSGDHSGGGTCSKSFKQLGLRLVCERKDRTFFDGEVDKSSTQAGWLFSILPSILLSPCGQLNEKLLKDFLPTTVSAWRWAPYKAIELI